MLLGITALLICVIGPFGAQSQAVTEIVTDYNGFWKTAATAVNPVKPDNHHNLLSFKYNNTSYSTGVNDALLTSQGETFVAGQYHALPLQNVNGTANSNTKIGLGAMVDGVYNGAGAAPSRTMGPYLNDGANGLDLGTCIANLPSGTMFMSVSNLQSAKIGDGVPDILVTQIADPSSNYDSYEFTDVNGVRVGNSLNVVLNNITAIGNWTADFYEATGSTILGAGFTQTDRAIRLWAADFSSFGLNASNIADIAYFKITLSGVSDIAFVAYNTTTVTVQQVLDFQALPERLRPASRIEALVDNITLAPNPSNGIVNISHPVAGRDATVSIINPAGVLVKRAVCAKGTGKTTVNVGGMGRGNFHVIYREKGKQITRKLMIL